MHGAHFRDLRPAEVFRTRWTLRRKIGFLAALVLALPSGVVVYTLLLLSTASHHLELVADVHLPIAKTVTAIQVHHVRQQVALERHLRFAPKADEYSRAQCRQASQALLVSAGLLQDEIDSLRWLVSLAATIDARYATLQARVDELAVYHQNSEARARELTRAVLEGHLEEEIAVLDQLTTEAEGVEHSADDLVAAMEELALSFSAEVGGRQRTVFWAGAISLSAMVTGVVLLLLLIQRFTLPLTDLSRLAEMTSAAIAEAEIPPERLKPHGSDEVGYFTQAFNQMLDRLSAHAQEQKRAEAALREAHDKLEERVEERTRTLFGTTAALEAEIQERERTEVSLHQMNESLEEALEKICDAQTQALQQERLRALGQMASGIAHDFNNALSPILGFSELLLSRPENLGDAAKVQRYLEMMNTAAKDATNIVSRMREFYRKRDEGDALRQVNLEQVVAQAISLTQPKWKDEAQARGAPIAIQTECGGAPDILGNESELREALTNLIFNACDAMPDGGEITIRARAEVDSRVVDSRMQAEWILLELVDTGAGMPEDVRRRCLDPFFTTKGIQGTGMGLAMVYGIMQRHSGDIEIETAKGAGTTVTLRFPLPRGDAPGPEEGSTDPMPSALRVLVVDDDPSVREVTTEYLLADGHTVEVAKNGVEALEAVGSGSFDLVVTDRAMPEMSGDQLATIIRERAPETKIIMLTGFGMVMDHPPDDVDGIASKPITLTDLRRVVARVMTEG